LYIFSLIRCDLGVLFYCFRDVSDEGKKELFCVIFFFFKFRLLIQHEQVTDTTTLHSWLAANSANLIYPTGETRYRRRYENKIDSLDGIRVRQVDDFQPLCLTTSRRWCICV